MELNKLKKILIVGLGLMGGSYAMALKNKGYKVLALTKDKEDIDFALRSEIIDEGTTVPSKEFIEKADIIVFALYPCVFLKWIKEHKDKIKDGAILTDVTGVKASVVEEVQKIVGDKAEFIAAHPMAGKERSGVENSDSSIFKNANYIVVPTEKNTKYGITICKNLGETLGFKRISTLSVEEHDKMIAFLSQLTHCIAVSLMCSNDNENLVRYTGDSFRDLTRIARINENMWSELFLLNREPLLSEMENFKETFERLYTAVKDKDSETIKEMMRLSTKRRELFDNK
jgi:prephenate dehydrogenase